MPSRVVMLALALVALVIPLGTAFAHPSLWAPINGPQQLMEGLARVRAICGAGSASFSEVDSMANGLTEQFPSYQGLIEFEVAQYYMQNQPRPLDKIIEYCRRSLDHLDLNELSRRAACHVYLGDVLRISGVPNGFPERRRLAAETYLQGLSEIPLKELPASPPVLPPQHNFNFQFSVPGVSDGADLERNLVERQLSEANRIQNLQRLCLHRDVLIRQIRSLYEKEPYNLNELRDLLLKFKIDGLQLDQMLEGIPAARSHRRRQLLKENPLLRNQQAPPENRWERWILIIGVNVFFFALVIGLWFVFGRRGVQ